MANIYLNINVLDGTNCPIVSLIDPTDLSITINEEDPILESPNITVSVPQNSTVTITIDKPSYNSFINSIDIGSIDDTINIVLNQTVVVDFINIANSCHSYTISNNGIDSDSNVTYSITDLDGNIIDDNEDIELDFGTSKTFTSSNDNVYLFIVKDSIGNVIRQYIVIDYCTILNCVSTRILDILCTCNCEDKHSSNHNCEDFCKKDFEMKRIFLLGFDLFNRINKEYRLNSYYTTIDNMEVNSLKAIQTDIDNLNTYCKTCGCSDTIDYSLVLNSTSTSKPDCGCS